MKALHGISDTKQGHYCSVNADVYLIYRYGVYVLENVANWTTREIITETIYI